MSKVVTVMNMKGGVGKTTVSMLLGGFLAIANYGHRSRRILLIDYDPQFNLSQAFLTPSRYQKLEMARHHTLAVLQDDETDIDPYALQLPGSRNPPEPKDIATSIFKVQGGGELLLVPSTIDLMYIALGQHVARLDPIEERFRKFIQKSRLLYDVIIIDCHPAGSVFTKTSLRNSDHVVIPVAPERYAIRGIGIMLKFIEANRIISASLVPHILFNRVPRTGTSYEERHIRSQRSLADLCFGNTVKHYKAFADPQSGRDFVWSSKKPYSNQAWYNAYAVCSEAVSRMSL